MTTVNILMVDDIPANLLALQALLDQPDYNLITAPSGEKALECLLTRQDFALILMDVQMPGLNGFETVTMIKKNRKCRAIPIVFLTAISKESQYVDQGYQVGAIDYLTKPYNPTVLLAKVSAFADMYRTQQSIRQEITCRKQMESQFYLVSKAIEDTKESIMITDAATTIISVNRAFERITGYSKQEAIGKTPRILQSGRQSKDFYQALWKTLTKQGYWRGKIWNRRKNGEMYLENISITAICNEQNETTHFISVFSDITQQSSLEEQLLQSQKMEAIGILAGGIAHDFNNMISGMVGNLYLAKKKSADHPDAMVHLNNIETLCTNSATMIAQLMTFARKGMVEKHNLSFQACIQETLKLVSLGLSENIVFEKNIVDDAPLMVYADSTQMQQVVMNLLNNAHDAVMDVPEPTIILNITRHIADKHFLQQHPELQGNAFVHLSIRDNGCGIPKQNQAHVFEPFFTSKEAGKGTGLGLAMCYGAVQEHHGSLSVESEVGSGTTFHLFLPLLDQAQAENETIAPPIKESCMGGSATILLADDAISVREPCGEFLRDLGYTIIEAEDGKQALELHAKHHQEIALALIDVVMPYLGGPPLATKMRELTPDLPIIFITGYDRNSVIDKDHPIEDCTVLSKPYPYPKLGMLIKQMLANKP